MSKILFNEHQRRQLESNPAAASVSDRAIQYTAEFKIKAVKEYQAGKGPVQIEWQYSSRKDDSFRSRIIISKTIVDIYRSLAFIEKYYHL